MLYITSICTVVAVVAIIAYYRGGMRNWRLAATVAVACFILGALYLYLREPGPAGLEIACTAFWAWAAWHDWKNQPPRNQKKALRALGVKALARLKALKKAMPRVRVPQLKPVPA